MSKVDINYKTLFHTAVMCVIMFGFGAIPSPEAVTQYGMSIAGVFFSLVYGWTFLGILWPSLLGMFGLAFTGYGTVEKVALDMFSNSTIFMMLVGSLAFMALLQSKAADFIMAKIIGSRMAQKSPTALVTIIFLAIVAVGSFGAQFVLYFGIFPIMVATLKKCGYKIGERFNVMFLTGFMMAVALGMCFRPFVGWGLMTVGTMMSLTQTQISYGAYMILMVLIDVIFIFTYPLFMKLCRCDFTKLKDVDIKSAFEVEDRLNLAQKIVLAAMFIFIIIVVLGSVLGVKLGIIYTFYTQVSVAGMMVLFWIAMTVIKVDGKPLLNLREASAGFSWDMLFLVAVALLISTVLTSADTGISIWISSIITPLFPSGGVSFLVALAVLTLILTNCANNIAICFIMINIVSAMYTNGFPVNLLAATMIISIVSVLAFLTPASSMPGAMLHACDMLTPGAVYRNIPIIMVYTIFLMLVVLIPASYIF